MSEQEMRRLAEELMPELEQVRIVARSQISDLAREAEIAPRRRTHLLLHSGPQDQVQRLMIVLQPGTYIRPHHHSEQWELVVLLQGRGDLLRFDGSGCLADRIELSTRAQVAQIPAGVWHGFVVREEDTAVLEIKPGPYRPNEFVDWAPEEGAPDASRMVEWLSGAKLGATWSGRAG
jgi:cupin fold WbuC family metalloprotein